MMRAREEINLKLTDSDAVIVPGTFRHVLIYISINPRHLAMTDLKNLKACELVDGDKWVG
jgi:hypothetical protein